MIILRVVNAIWNNVLWATAIAFVYAIVHFIVWGEPAKQIAYAYALFFFIMFNAGDVLVWTLKKLLKQNSG